MNMNQPISSGLTPGEQPRPATVEQDTSTVSNAEQAPQTAPSPETKTHSNDQTNQNQNQPLVLPAVDLSSVAAAVSPSADDQATDDNPLIADDVDVIEKEWVDKAKSIIQATEHDPRVQEQEINKLQQAYLEKRYGKKITKMDK